MKNNTIILKNRPVGIPLISDFEFMEEPMPVCGKGQILLKTIYVSVDPYLRGKMSGTKTPRFELGFPMSSKIIAEVIDSNHEKFNQGEFVGAYLDWKEYFLSDGTGLTKVDSNTINTHGRIPVCDTISSYNDTGTAQTSLSLLPIVVYKFIFNTGFSDWRSG